MKMASKGRVGKIRGGGGGGGGGGRDCEINLKKFEKY
jgi:hypothetical protein